MGLARSILVVYVWAKLLQQRTFSKSVLQISCSVVGTVLKGKSHMNSLKVPVIWLTGGKKA